MSSMATVDSYEVTVFLSSRWQDQKQALHTAVNLIQTVRRSGILNTGTVLVVVGAVPL